MAALSAQVAQLAASLDSLSAKWTESEAKTEARLTQLEQLYSVMAETLKQATENGTRLQQMLEVLQARRLEEGPRVEGLTTSSGRHASVRAHPYSTEANLRPRVTANSQAGNANNGDEL